MFPPSPSIKPPSPSIERSGSNASKHKPEPLVTMGLSQDSLTRKSSLRTQAAPPPAPPLPPNGKLPELNGTPRAWSIATAASTGTSQVKRSVDGTENGTVDVMKELTDILEKNRLKKSQSIECLGVDPTSSNQDNGDKNVSPSALKSTLGSQASTQELPWMAELKKARSMDNLDNLNGEKTAATSQAPSAAQDSAQIPEWKELARQRREARLNVNSNETKTAEVSGAAGQQRVMIPRNLAKKKPAEPEPQNTELDRHLQRQRAKVEATNSSASGVPHETAGAPNDSNGNQGIHVNGNTTDASLEKVPPLPPRTPDSEKFIAADPRVESPGREERPVQEVTYTAIKQEPVYYGVANGKNTHSDNTDETIQTESVQSTSGSTSDGDYDSADFETSRPLSVSSDEYDHMGGANGKNTHSDNTDKTIQTESVHSAPGVEDHSADLKTSRRSSVSSDEYDHVGGADGENMDDMPKNPEVNGNASSNLSVEESRSWRQKIKDFFFRQKRAEGVTIQVGAKNGDTPWYQRMWNWIRRKPDGNLRPGE